MADKWVGIYTPKMMYPYWKEQLEVCKNAPEVKESEDYEQEVQLGAELIERLADILLEKGVNTVVFDACDIELIDGKLMVTSGAINSKEDKLPENGVIPDAIYHRFRKLDIAWHEMNHWIQSTGLWDKFGGDHEKILSSYDEVFEELSKQNPVRKDELRQVKIKKGVRVEMPFYKSISAEIPFYFELQKIPVIPPMQISFLGTDKGKFYTAVKNFIPEKSEQAHEDYDLYLPRTRLLSNNVEESKWITDGSWDWRKKYPWKLKKKCLGVVKPLSESCGRGINFLKDQREVQNAYGVSGVIAGIVRDILGRNEPTHIIQEYIPLVINKKMEFKELKRHAGHPYIFRILLDDTDKNPIMYAYVGKKSKLDSHSEDELVRIDSYDNELKKKIKELHEVFKKSYALRLKEEENAEEVGHWPTHLGVDAGIGYKEVETGKKKKILRYLVLIEVNDLPSVEKEILEEYTLRLAEDLFNLAS